MQLGDYPSRSKIPHGEQLRDFIYVKDVVKVMFWMMHTYLLNSLPENEQSKAENAEIGAGAAFFVAEWCGSGLLRRIAMTVASRSP